jgi:SsrA-binding protein
VAVSGRHNLSPRIANRRAFHDYHIESKLECGIALVGSEVKSLRQGLGQLQDAYVRVERGRLVLHGAYIDHYKQASPVFNHEPRRARFLLAHRREIRKLEKEQEQRGVTLIPLAIYFKDGRAKVEVAVARGKQQFDKRAAIKKKETERDLRKLQSYKR